MGFSKGVLVSRVSKGVVFYSNSISIGDPNASLVSITITFFGFGLVVSEISSMVGSITDKSVKGGIKNVFSIVGVGE